MAVEFSSSEELDPFNLLTIVFQIFSFQSRRTSMSEQMYPVTKQGHEQLKTELKHLMSVVRPEVVQAIVIGNMGT